MQRGYCFHVYISHVQRFVFFFLFRCFVFQLRSKIPSFKYNIINISSAFVGSCKSNNMHNVKCETRFRRNMKKKLYTTLTEFEREKERNKDKHTHTYTFWWRKRCFCLDLLEDLNEFIIEIYSSACIVSEIQNMNYECIMAIYSLSFRLCVYISLSHSIASKKKEKKL